MVNKHNVLVFVFSCLFSCALIAAETGIDGQWTALEADNPKVVQRGEVVYHAHCAACHGAELEGQANWRIRDKNGLLPAPPHDATGHTWHHADDLLFEITKFGASAVIGDPSYRAAMPVYEKLLSDDDIVAVLSFIKSTWPSEQREWQEQINAGRKGEIQPVQSGGVSLIEQLLNAPKD